MSLGRDSEGRIFTSDDLNEFYRKNHEKFVSYTFKITGNLDMANDIISSIYLKLIEKPPYIVGDFNNYFLRSIHNSFFTKARLEKNRIPMSYYTERELDSFEELKIDPYENYLHDEELDKKTAIVREIVKEMPPRIRKIFHHRIYDELSCQETADAVNSTEGAIKMETHRGYNFLRKKLKGHGIEWKSRPVIYNKKLERKLA